MKNVQEEPLNLSVNRRERSWNEHYRKLNKRGNGFLPSQEVERLIHSVEQEPLNMEIEHDMVNDLPCNENVGTSRQVMEVVEENTEEPTDDQQHSDLMRYNREIKRANKKKHLKEITTDDE